MSRVIKVRIWDKETKQYVENATNCQIDWTLWDFTNFNLKFKDRVIVEQYTGRNDINGKEICEGDVCRLTYYTKSKKERKWHKNLEDINEVKFEDGCFKFSNTDKYGIGSELSFSDCYEFSTADGSYKYEVEIIGNIHKEIKKC